MQLVLMATIPTTIRPRVVQARVGGSIPLPLIDLISMWVRFTVLLMLLTPPCFEAVARGGEGTMVHTRSSFSPCLEGEGDLVILRASDLFLRGTEGPHFF